MIVQNFGTKFLSRRGECKTRENSNFLKNGKMVVSVKIQNFSRSRMMKRISPLESSRESSYHVEFHRILRQLEFHVFRDTGGLGTVKWV